MPEVKKYRPNIGAPRTAPNEEPAAERACDFRPVDTGTGFTKEDAIAEANRCHDCKKPLCMQGCPVGVNIPGFISKIRDEDWAGALETIKGDNLLPSVCGRVCPQDNKFEGKCILGRKVEAVAIGQLEGIDALYLAVGAGLPRFLKVPGENLPGVYCGNEYLTRTNILHAYDFHVYDNPIRQG